MKQTPIQRIATLLRYRSSLKQEDLRFLVQLQTRLQLGQEISSIPWRMWRRVARIKAYLANPREPRPCGSLKPIRVRDAQGDYQEVMIPHACQNFYCKACHPGVKKRELRKAKAAFESLGPLDRNHLSWVTLFADHIRPRGSEDIHQDARVIRRRLNNLGARAPRAGTHWGYTQVCFKEERALKRPGVLVHWHGWVWHPHLTRDELRLALKQSFRSTGAVNAKPPKPGRLMGNIQSALGYSMRQGWTDKGINSIDSLALARAHHIIGPNLKAFRISGGFPKNESTVDEPSSSACGVVQVETPSSAMRIMMARQRIGGSASVPASATASVTASEASRRHSATASEASEASRVSRKKVLFHSTPKTPKKGETMNDPDQDRTPPASARGAPPTIRKFSDRVELPLQGDQRPPSRGGAVRPRDPTFY